MKLTSAQFNQLQQALLDAYTEFGLRQMLRVQMDVELDQVVGGSSFTEQTFDLIEWAERNGQTQRLIEAAYAGNQENPQLIKLAEDAQSWFPKQREQSCPSDGITPSAPSAQPPQNQIAIFIALIIGLVLVGAYATFMGGERGATALQMTATARAGAAANPSAEISKRTESPSTKPLAVEPTSTEVSIAKPTDTSTSQLTATSTSISEISPSAESTSIVTEIWVASGKKYSFDKCSIGDFYYIDDEYKILNFSNDDYDGLPCIKTSNDGYDKESDLEHFLKFTLNRPATILIYFDSRMERAPTWSADLFTLREEEVYVDDTDMDFFQVYACTSSAGKIVLGGPKHGEEIGSKSMYVVAFQEGGNSNQLCSDQLNVIDEEPKPVE